FAIANDTDARLTGRLTPPARLVGRFFGEPIDASEDLLQLIADDVLAELEGGAIDVFAVSQIRAAGKTGRVALSHLATDERRDEDAAAVFGQATGELRFGGHALGEATDLLGRLVGIGNGDDVGDSFAVGNQQQSFAVHLPDGGPADGEDVVVPAA